MPDKKHAATKPKPIQVIRSGEVTASISERQSNSGYSYRDITLTREWNSQATGRRAQGATFFEKHEEDLVRVIRQAAAWLRGDDQTPPDTATEVLSEDVA